MKNVDIYGLVIITLFIGGFPLFLGWIIKSQNAGDMLNGFDKKKYNKNKVSKIIGSDIFYSGLLIILLGVFGMFLGSKLYDYITFMQISIFIINIIKIMYYMEKKCRRKSNGKI